MLALLPSRWGAYPATVCLFDSKTGLVWKQEIDVTTILSSAAQQAIGTETEGGKGAVEVAEDGSRVLLVVGHPKNKQSAVFVFDGKGRLMTTLTFPNHRVASGAIQRTPAGHGFLLALYGPDMRPDKRGQPSTSDYLQAYLLDREGRLLGRFVDSDDGDVLRIRIVSQDDAYAVAYKDIETISTRKHYLYELPFAVDHPPIPDDEPEQDAAPKPKKGNP